MGNSFGCSASGERLVSAARDGDFVEAKMLLEWNPCLAKYSTFGGLNSPLHFAAAKGHNEVQEKILFFFSVLGKFHQSSSFCIFSFCFWSFCMLILVWFLVPICGFWLLSLIC